MIEGSLPEVPSTTSVPETKVDGPQKENEGWRARLARHFKPHEQIEDKGIERDPQKGISIRRKALGLLPLEVVYLVSFLALREANQVPIAIAAAQPPPAGATTISMIIKETITDDSQPEEGSVWIENGIDQLLAQLANEASTRTVRAERRRPETERSGERATAPQRTDQEENEVLATAQTSNQLTQQNELNG